METRRNELLKMTCGTFAFVLFFTAVCAFVMVRLPEDDVSVRVGGLFDRSSGLSLPEADGEPAAAAGSEADGGQLEDLDDGPLGFIAAAETDVGLGLDFSSYETVNDTELVLYRNRDTRSYVEWFYTQLTGNRDVALAILDAASQFDVAPSLAFALAYTESKYVTDATHTNVNGSVDRGLFQLNSYSFPKLTEEEFFDAATSAYYGMSHLNYCLEASTSQIAGLAMYNAGRNKVNGDRTPQSTLNYISKILEYKAKIDNEFSTKILAFYSDGNNGRYLAKY